MTCGLSEDRRTIDLKCHSLEHRMTLYEVAIHLKDKRGEEHKTDCPQMTYGSAFSIANNMGHLRTGEIVNISNSNILIFVCRIILYIIIIYLFINYLFPLIIIQYYMTFNKY